jgi:hypothetical protein
MKMEASTVMERQRELQVNTTKFAKILAIRKKGLKMRYGACDMQA